MHYFNPDSTIKQTLLDQINAITVTANKDAYLTVNVMIPSKRYDYNTGAILDTANIGYNPSMYFASTSYPDSGSAYKGAYAAATTFSAKDVWQKITIRIPAGESVTNFGFSQAGGTGAAVFFDDITVS